LLLHTNGKYKAKLKSKKTKKNNNNKSFWQTQGLCFSSFTFTRFTLYKFSFKKKSNFGFVVMQ